MILFSRSLLSLIDGFGIYGSYFHYGVVISLVGSAFIIFLYLWHKKRLDMDEEPKFQMMQDDVEKGEIECQTRDKKKGVERGMEKK